MFKILFLLGACILGLVLDHLEVYAKQKKVTTRLRAALLASKNNARNAQRWQARYDAEHLRANDLRIELENIKAQSL